MVSTALRHKMCIEKQLRDTLVRIAWRGVLESND